MPPGGCPCPTEVSPNTALLPLGPGSQNHSACWERRWTGWHQCPGLLWTGCLFPWPPDCSFPSVQLLPGVSPRGLGFGEDGQGGPAFLPHAPEASLLYLWLLGTLPQGSGVRGLLGSSGHSENRNQLVTFSANPFDPQIGQDSSAPCRICSPLTMVTGTLGEPLASEDGNFLQGHS